MTIVRYMYLYVFIRNYKQSEQFVFSNDYVFVLYIPFIFFKWFYKREKIYKNELRRTEKGRKRGYKT